MTNIVEKWYSYSMAKAIRLLTLSFLSLLIFIEFFHPITSLSSDLGRHIKMGEIMWQTKQVVTTNLFSYTYPNFPFINHHWFSEVIFYLMQHTFGMNSLIILTTVCYASCFFLLYLYLRKKTSLFSLSVSFFLSIGILALRTDIRPEMFSMLFTTIFVIVLYRYREKYTHLIFILPFLEVLWVNLHIYFIIGPIIVGLFLLEAIIKRTLYTKKLFFILAGVFICTCLATLINPHGLTGAVYPFQVFHNYGLSIAENLDIFSLDLAHSIFFFLSLLLFFASLLISIKQTKGIDWLLGIVFGILAITAVRNIALYAFVVIIPFSLALDQVILPLWQEAKQKLPYAQTPIYSFLFLSILLTTAWYIPFPAKNSGIGLGFDYGPQYAGAFYLQNHLPGNVYNNFDMGSYLDYILYPKQQTFVDGRPEAFPTNFFTSVYLPSENNPTVFESITKQYNLNTIVWDITDYTPESANFLYNIVRNPQWKLVYLDEHSVILVKDIKQNSDVTHQYAMTESTIRISHPSHTMLGLQKSAAFFQEVGWDNALLKITKQMLTNNPNDCPTIRATIKAYLDLGQGNVADTYSQRYSLFCQ